MLQMLRRIGQINVVALRYKHRNHPGHKPKPPAYVVKLDLPDRYLDEAMYPPVKPRLPPGEWPADYDPSLAWLYWEEGEKFTRLRTIQERMSVMAYLNVQQTLDDVRQRRTRHFPIFLLSARPVAPRMSPFASFITKTAITTTTNSQQDAASQQLHKSIDADFYEKLKHTAQQTILMSLNQVDELPDKHEPPAHPDTYKPESVLTSEHHRRVEASTDALIKRLFKTLASLLASRDPNRHLVDAQYGDDVSIRAYWKRCGFGKVRPRGALPPDPDCIRFQFDDKAVFQIKCDKPLMPIYSMKEAVDLDIKIPDYAYEPAVFKIFADHILPKQTPGHWFGDPREFNYLTVFNTSKTMHYLQTRLSDYDDHFEMLKSMAMLCAHAELTAQAYYLGFSMWKDLTYPLLGQYVFTNGQDYSFMDYQLNTIRLFTHGSKASNLAYLSLPERLFEVNAERSEITKFNEDVFKRLLNTLTQRQPVKNETELVATYSPLDYMIGGTRLRPYLAVHDMETQLTKRHRLLATSLYELVKYDRPMDYLTYRSTQIPDGHKPRLHRLYDKYTYQYRDIVLDYYPRDFYGFSLVEQLTRNYPRQKYQFWDLKTPVYEWANVPPPDINNVPRKIDLPTFQ